MDRSSTRVRETNNYKNEQKVWSVNVIRPAVSVSHKVRTLGLSLPMITCQRNGFQVLEEDSSRL